MEKALATMNKNANIVTVTKDITKNRRPQNMSRYKRQNMIVPDTIHTEPVAIIGCGAIGRQVILQLASMGVTKFALYDFDQVDETNICTQGYKECQMGEKKVLVMQDAVHEINSEAEVGAMCVKFTEHSLPFLAKVQKRFKWEKPIKTIFCCVDSITARERIFEAVKEDCEFFVDGRMTAESLRVLTVTDDKEYYPTTIFPQEEAQGGQCTAKSTIYCANIAAGMMCSQYTKHLRSFALSQDLLFNILGEVLETV